VLAAWRRLLGAAELIEKLTEKLGIDRCAAAIQQLDKRRAQLKRLSR